MSVARSELSKGPRHREEATGASDRTNVCNFTGEQGEESYK